MSRTPRRSLDVGHRWWWATAAVLALVVALGYRHSLGLGLLADDLVLLSQARDRALHLGLLGVDREWVFHRPLVQLVWSAVARVADAQPAPYHAVSLLVHWLNCLLVVALVRQLAPAGRGLAVGAGLLFALLPLHVEAVAWPASLYDLFATLFYLLALLVMLLFWRRRRTWHLGLALLAYQLCLWSKEIAFTWPLAALLLAATVPARPRWRVVGLSLAPFAALLALNLTQRLVAWGDLGGYRDAPRDVERFLWDTLASALAGMLVPLNSLLWPDPILQLWWLAAAALVLAGLLTMREPRLFVFSLAWIVVTVLPALNLLPLGPGLEGSRLLYLPAVGASIALATLVDAVASAAEKADPRRRRDVSFAALTLLLVLVYLAALEVNFRPWQAASRIVTSLPAELHELVSAFAPGSTLEVTGMPRVYRGAQVFNLGFDHAFVQRYGSWFDLRLATTPHAPVTAPDGDRFWLTLAEDVALATWRPSELRAVLAPENDVGATGTVVAVVAATDCHAWNAWTVLGAAYSCAPQRGLLVRPTDRDAGLISPGFDVPAHQWLRVAVDMAAAGPEHGAANGNSLQLYWHTPENWFDESRSQRIPLVPPPTLRRYLVFVPPDESAAAPNQIRIDPTDGNGPMRIERVEIRSLAP